MHSIPLGPSEKNSFCAKATKKARYVRSLGKKPHFGAFPEAKKGVVNSQGCARLRTGPIIMQIPRGYQKKSLLCRKARYVRSLGKKPHFWPSQRLKKLIGSLSCLHKGPKCIQSLCYHPKKIPFVQKHKEGAICAILREKTPFFRARIPRG